MGNILVRVHAISFAAQKPALPLWRPVAPAFEPQFGKKRREDRRRVSLSALYAGLIARVFGVGSSVTHPMLRAINEKRGVILRHTVHDTSQAARDLEKAIAAGTSYEIDGNLVRLSDDDRYTDDRWYFVNAHHPLTYRDEYDPPRPFPSADNPKALHPAKLLPGILESGLFTKFDFKCPEAVDLLGPLAVPVPKAQKMGHMFLKELMVDGVMPRRHEVNLFLTLDDLERARAYMGDAPFQASCYGVTPENLTPELAETFARRIQGKAQYINFFLNYGERINPPLSIVKMLWEKYGLVTEIKIDSEADKQYWDAQGIPYLGTTNDNDLATPIATR